MNTARITLRVVFTLVFMTGFAHGVTTPGVLSLSSTFDCISVRASFMGDPNGNNSATIRFRKQGDIAWKDAFTPIIDRRTTVDGNPNAYINQARGSIVGLQPGTVYEVSLTFVDPDGVSGTAALTGTVSTLAPAPPLSGNTLYVDDVAANGNGSSASPFNSIPNALVAATAGTTILVRPGTYPAFTISKSGNASGWIAIAGESRDQVFISGGTSDSIDVNGNYIQLKNLRLKLPGHNGISVSGVNHTWIENIYVEDLMTVQYYDAGVNISNASDVYVLNSQIYSPSLTATPPYTPRWESRGEGIFVGAGVRNLVIKGNIIDGGYLDCIGNSPEGMGGGAMDNSDIANNTITNCKDDAIQMEGDDVNLRIWGNDIFANNGYSAIATQTGFVGPIYMFRNKMRVTWAGDGGTCWKAGGVQFLLLFHNVCDTSGQAHDGLADSDGKTISYVTALNNIFKTRGNPLYKVYSTGTTMNNNLYFRTTSGSIVSSWNGSANYATVSAFRTGTGMETNGLQGDPLFLSSAEDISSASPAYNAGAVIPNFNDASSAWPYTGSAPDIGAFEVGGAPPPPPPPTGSACDLNNDSSTNVSDVQLCANQAITVSPCTTGDINHDSTCNVIDVQRVVNAALGGQCVTQ